MKTLFEKTHIRTMLLNTTGIVDRSPSSPICRKLIESARIRPVYVLYMQAATGIVSR